jgi:phosphatidylethanolamine/phosphatidyl-N-methylethanolamine N-methyltransferase
MTAEYATVARAYERWANVYDVVFGGVLQAGRRLAVSTMRLQPGERLLEVGVGTGLTLPLYPSGPTVLGVDYSPPMLEQAQRRLMSMDDPQNVTLMRADAAKLPFDDASFDVVYAPYVISVVPDPVRVGLELRRVCKPSGRILLLNHFRREPHPAWFERLLAPLAAPLGFKSDLPLSPLLASCRLRPLSIQPVNVPPIWKLVVCTPQ